MTSYSRSQLSNDSLVHRFKARLALDCSTTADLLADVGEIDFRKLYRRAAYPSMYLYLVNHMHMSEDVACNRICAARAARRFPVLFHAVADGRLSLSAVVLLSRHLTHASADELVAAAAHRTRPQLQMLLAEHSPKPDVPTLIRPIEPPRLSEQPVFAPPAWEELSAPGRIDPAVLPGTHLLMEPLPAPVAAAAPPYAKRAPLSASRFEWHLTVDRSTQEKLERARELLGHAVPAGDVARVLDRALDALIKQLETQRFGKADRPQPQGVTAKGRHVPRDVKRKVYARDGGRCTFVGDNKKRCDERADLEFDHIQPVARGGQTTVTNLRLRCRAHNQYEAEQMYGHEFMRGRRNAARERAAGDNPSAAKSLT